ncbi:hypothetical protein [Acidithiobacillus sp. HP-6]|nr:hypothetical protein [Acidithiobacillus sp. HP-6]
MNRVRAVAASSAVAGIVPYLSARVAMDPSKYALMILPLSLRSLLLAFCGFSFCAIPWFGLEPEAGSRKPEVGSRRKFTLLLMILAYGHREVA